MQLQTAAFHRVLDHPLFDGSDPEKVAPIVARLRPVRVGRGDVVTSGLARHAMTYLVLQGSLHPYVLTADGRRVVLEVVGPGGYDGLLLASGHVGHLCEAASDGVLVPLAMQDLDRLIAADPRIAVNLLNLTLTRLERREAHMLGMAHSDGLRRVAHQLAALARYAGVREGDWYELSPRPTHQILSEMIGIRRETVSLQLSALRRLGAVGISGRTMRLNVAKLSRIADRPGPHQRNQQAAKTAS